MTDLHETTAIQCNQCGEPFEIEPPAPDYPQEEIIVQVECDKGKFCCEPCRAQAMYEAQDEDGRKALRRMYLGLRLVLENRRDVNEIFSAWDIGPVIDGDPAAMTALSPEGGVHGKEGPEDECESLLMPAGARKLIWNGLWKGRFAATLELVRAEQMDATYLGEVYKAEVVAVAKKKLADAEAAFKALEELRSVME
jgi:hypothetical protein